MTWLYERVEHQKWREHWGNAIRNMPYHASNSTARARAYYLGRCLGISKERVIKSSIHGTCPMDDEVRERLLSFAGPYGTALAIMNLVTQGISPDQLRWGSGPE